MTFADLLGELMEMIGWPVHVTAGPSEGFPVLAVSGAITRTTELTGDQAPLEDGVVFVGLNPSFNAGFVLIRRLFNGAEWNLGELHVKQGALLITIAPDS